MKDTMQSRLVVLVRYNERMEWLKTIMTPYLIYDKSEDPHPFAIMLPNISRESHGYLVHIILNYENLDDITWFCQAEPFVHTTYPKCPDRPKEIPELCRVFKLKEVESFYPLSPFGECIVNENEQLPMDEFYFDLFGHEHPKTDGLSKYKFNIGACFGVNKNTILKHPKEFYKKCLDMLLSGNYRVPNSNVPYYRNNCAEWIMERMWMQIFN